MSKVKGRRKGEAPGIVATLVAQGQTRQYILGKEIDDAHDHAGRTLRHPGVHGRPGAGPQGPRGSGPRPSPGSGGLREAHRTAVRTRRRQDRGHGRRRYRYAGVVADLSWRRAARRCRGGSVRRETNDLLAEAVRHHPDRFAGFAALPTAAPEAAADELERTV